MLKRIDVLASILSGHIYMNHNAEFIIRRVSSVGVGIIPCFLLRAMCCSLHPSKSAQRG